jgi:hypothetical protein
MVQWHDIFDLWFFHESTTDGARSFTLNYFRIRCQIGNLRRTPLIRHQHVSDNVDAVSALSETMPDQSEHQGRVSDIAVPNQWCLRHHYTAVSAVADLRQL